MVCAIMSGHWSQLVALSLVLLLWSACGDSSEEEVELRHESATGNSDAINPPQVGDGVAGDAKETTARPVAEDEGHELDSLSSNSEGTNGYDDASLRDSEDVIQKVENEPLANSNREEHELVDEYHGNDNVLDSNGGTEEGAYNSGSEEEESGSEEQTFALFDDGGGEIGDIKIVIKAGSDVKMVIEEDKITDIEEDHNVDLREEGDDLYAEAMKMFPKSTSVYEVDSRPYKLLAEAAAKGNNKAKEQIAYLYLFGVYVPRNISQSFELFSELAANGVPGGQMGLGFMYSTGLGVNASQTKAITYYTFAALQGHHLAQIAKGYRTHMGINVPQSCENALGYYSKVAQSVADSVTVTGGAAVSRIRLLDEEEQTSDSGNMDEDLIQYYQFLAEKGDTQAQMLLGQLFMQGLRGVTRNFKKALYYFSLALEEKNSAAQGFIGKIYVEGSEDVPASNETALEYFKEAAKMGNPIGLSGLGLMYLHGMGTDQDYTKAFKYSSQSAEMGWLDGQLQLGIMYYYGYGMKRNFRQALKYFSLASQSGSTLAMYYLGIMHSFGVGVMRSCHTAVEFMRAVAEKGWWNGYFLTAYEAYKMGDMDSSYVQYLLLSELGYEVAQSNAAYMAENKLSGLVMDKLSVKRSLMLWTRAASQGYGIARLKVGDYYYYGMGVDSNFHTAALHYRVASEQQGVARAMFNLGYMYEQGEGFDQDFHLAKRYYDLAVETDQDAQVPVGLSLLKLHFNYYTKLFASQVKTFDVATVALYLKAWFGANWDIYLITFLTLLSTLIYLTRQHRRLEQRRNNNNR